MNPYELNWTQRIILAMAGAILLSLSACTATLYQPTLTEITRASKRTDLELPSNSDIWLYAESLMSNFAKRIDLDAGIDFGGNVGDALLSATTIGLAAGGAGVPLIGYFATAEGVLRRLMGIASPIVRANALSGGVRNLRLARSQFLVDLVAEGGRTAKISGTQLTGAGVRFFQSVEATVNMVIAGLMGSWPSLPEMMQATPIIPAPAAGGGVKLEALKPTQPAISLPMPVMPGNTKVP